MTWLTLLASAGHEAAGHASHVNWFSWAEREQWPPMGWAILNFIVLILVLKKIVWPNIRERARRRSAALAQKLDDAKRARDEASARVAEYDRRLKAIDDEMSFIVQQIRAEAEAERARVVTAANEHSARLRREADFSISQETKQLKIDLEREVAQRALQAAEKLLRARVDDAVDRALQEEFLAAVGRQGSITTAGDPR